VSISVDARSLCEVRSHVIELASCIGGRRLEHAEVLGDQLPVTRDTTGGDAGEVARKLADQMER